MLHSMNFFVYKIGAKFDRGPLVVEPKKYAAKIINAYTVKYTLYMCLAFSFRCHFICRLSKLFINWL